MLNILFLILNGVGIIFFPGLIFVVALLVIDVIRDVYQMFSNVAFAISIIIGSAVIIFMTCASILLAIDCFNQLEPLWKTITGVG